MGRLRAALERTVGRPWGAYREPDPFGPPLDAPAVERLLAAVAAARFAEPAPPFASPLPTGDLRNDRVHARVLHEPRDARWAVLAPPYGSVTLAGGPGLFAMHARLLARAGLGVLLLPLPYHGLRARSGGPSGLGHVSADLGRTQRALAQGAAEAAAAARWLRERRGAARVGGYGISLGGAAVGLASALAEGAFDALALQAAADRSSAYYYTGVRRAPRRATLAAHGFREPELERVFAPLAPSSHAAPFEGERATFAIPPFDAVVPAPSQERWRAAWRGARVPTGPVGHAGGIASPLVTAALARRLARAL